MKTASIATLVILLLVCLQSGFRPLQEPETVVQLGEMLFFDPILSIDRTISCGSCHKREFAFADTVKFSEGVFGKKGVRNTPSAMNQNLKPHFFWDGRATTLEQQALMPIENPDEMGLPIDSAVQRLRNKPVYTRAFRKFFNDDPNKENLAKALVAFERTLDTNQSPFDDWRMNENESAVSESVKRGFEIFNDKAQCVQCHFGADFNNEEFRNIGLFDNETLIDSGRAATTKKPADLGKFKIGPLRNIALTAPYMHNGMFATLREVIEYYDDPDKIISNAINRDPLLNQPLKLTEEEKVDLENFLRALTDKQFINP